VASEGFEPPKAEPADLQLSGAISKKSLFTNVPQYFIGQATLNRYVQLSPFPSIERNLNGKRFMFRDFLLLVQLRVQLTEPSKV
jgi:hypothetical protein